MRELIIKTVSQQDVNPAEVVKLRCRRCGRETIDSLELLAAEGWELHLIFDDGWLVSRPILCPRCSMKSPEFELLIDQVYDVRSDEYLRLHSADVWEK